MHNHPKRRALLFAILISGLGLLVLILTDWLPWLRGPIPDSSEWHWPYLLRPFSHWWLPLLIGALLLTIAAHWLRQPENAKSHRLLLALSVTIIAMQLSLIYADRPAVLAELVDRTQSNLASGYFEPAADIPDLNAALQNYPALMPTFASEHAQTHPPGLIIANNLTIQLLSNFPRLSLQLAQPVYPGRCIDLWLLPRPYPVAAALLLWSLLPIVAAALTLWPAWALARVWLPPAAARLAVLLIGTLPALLLFAPKVVQFYPALALLLFWTLHRGLVRARWGWLLLAGLIYSLLTFLSLGNVTLALPIALYAVLWLWQNGRFTPAALVQTALPLILGGLTIWLGYWLGWGVAPWAIVQTGLQQHYELVTRYRPYDLWLLWNLIDVVVYAGWPTVVGFGLGLAAAIRAARRRQLTPVAMMALALGLLLLLLDVSGSARGEVGRIWIFFYPLLALVAASALARHFPQPRQQALLVALQLLIAIGLGLAWRPVRAVNVVPQRPIMADATPTQTTAVAFTETIANPIAIELAGYTLAETAVAPGDTLPFTLFWQSEDPTIRPYTVFTQLLAPDNTLIAQKDNWPVNGQWPPTCWTDGSPIIDNYVLTVPAGTPPGQYRLVVGLYDADSGSRLPASNGDDAFQLGTITVTP